MAKKVSKKAGKKAKKTNKLHKSRIAKKKKMIKKNNPRARK